MRRSYVDSKSPRKGKSKVAKKDANKMVVEPVVQNVVVDDDDDEDEDVDVDLDDVSSSDEIGPSSVQKYVEQLSQGLGLVSTPKSNKKRKNQRKDSDTSSEEERWLDAIQSGKLDEVDEELKKVKSKDPKLMTARQRAMLERKYDKDLQGDTSACSEPTPSEIISVVEPLVALPSGYKEEIMTEEAIQRKALKSQKRKEKADEKREKDMKRTMERLLKKQDAKTIKGSLKKGGTKRGPSISYIDNEDGPRIVLPAGVDFGVKQKLAQQPPAVVMCQGPACTKPKRYSCKNTGIPLCSLECYQRNIARRV